MTPLLSVLCPSYRKEFLDVRFQEQVRSSKYKKLVEFIILNDNGQMSTGIKQKHLVAMSSGLFIMFVADDDIVSPKLLPIALDHLDPKKVEGLGYIMRMHPQLHRGLTCQMGPMITEEVRDIDEEKGCQVWRWHPICPTARYLFDGIDWRDASVFEDVALAEQIGPKLTPAKWKFIADELYFAFPQEGQRWQGGRKYDVQV